MNIYVLKLKEGKYYIGKTGNVKTRLDQHIEGYGSAWTRKYSVLHVKEIVVEKHGFSELAVTLDYMKRYGVDNVRGADYCTLTLSKTQMDEIKRHMCAEEGRCYRCGKEGHYISDCNSYWSFKSCLNWFWCCKKKRKDGSYQRLRSATFAEQFTEQKLQNDHILNFGKHHDKTYSEVYKRYPDYCEWVLEQKSTGIDFCNFQKWLRLTTFAEQKLRLQ